MEYTIKALSDISGVSARTLRYYDKLGLLKPLRINESGYRIYGDAQVNMLQQILFYRELGMPLKAIGRIISDPSFERVKALETHLVTMRRQRARLDTLINTIETTMLNAKGEYTMSEKEKFEGFKRKLISDNELRYGKEIRAKYGDDVIEASNNKLESMTPEEYEDTVQLEKELNTQLAYACKSGDPASEPAQHVCALHKRWLMRYWPSYSKQAHLSLGEMYVQDERFKAYYELIAPGCAVFLRDALRIYCS
jgi:DNA-binding transcriptional MerR regulator